MGTSVVGEVVGVTVVGDDVGVSVVGEAVGVTVVGEVVALAVTMVVFVVVAVFVEGLRRPFQNCGCFVENFLLDSRRLILGWLVHWDPHCTGQG